MLHVASILSCSAGKPAPRIGDGGASWRMKALARAKRQVEDPEDPNYGKRLQEVVGKHWGSLADLTQGLGQERAAHGEGQSWETCLKPAWRGARHGRQESWAVCHQHLHGPECSMFIFQHCLSMGCMHLEFQ